MKNLVLGLALGIGVGGAGYHFLAAPKMKQTSYEDGMKAGITDGMAKAKEEAMAEADAKIAAQKVEQQKVLDNINAEAAAKVAAANARKAAAKPKETKPEIENWHVIGGQIADPITQ